MYAEHEFHLILIHPTIASVIVKIDKTLHDNHARLVHGQILLYLAGLALASDCAALGQHACCPEMDENESPPTVS